MTISMTVRISLPKDSSIQVVYHIYMKGMLTHEELFPLIYQRHLKRFLCLMAAFMAPKPKAH